MSFRRQVARGALWTGLESWYTQAVSFATVIVLARILGPEAYGLVGMALVFVSITRFVLGDSGWTTALVQKKDLEPAHLDTAFWFMTVVGGVLTAAMILGAPLIAAVFDQTIVEDLTIALSPIVLVTAVASVPMAVLRRELKFQELAMRSIISITIASGVGLAMTILGYGVWSLIGLQLTQAVASLVMIWRFCPWRPGLALSRRHLQELWNYGLAMVANQFLTFLNDNLTRFLVGYFMGPAALGIYSLALRIFEALSHLILVPVSKVAMPAFAKLQSDPPRLAQMYGRGVEIASLLVFPAAFGFAAVAPILVPCALGEAWVDAVPTIQLLMIALLVTPLGHFSAAALQGTGHAAIWLRITTVSFVISVTVLGIVFFITTTSVVAVAGAFVARRILVLPLTLSFVRRLLHIDPVASLRRAIPVLAAAAIMSAAVLAMTTALPDGLPQPPVIVAATALGVACYVAAIWLLARTAFRQAVDLMRATITRSG